MEEVDYGEPEVFDLDRPRSRDEVEQADLSRGPRQVVDPLNRPSWIADCHDEAKVAKLK